MRPINILRTIAVAGAVLLAPSAMSAQSAPVRTGLDLSLGLGAGSNGLSCTGCASDRRTGMSGFLRVGKAMSQNMILGAELNAWNKTENGATARTGMLSAIAQWYPSATNGYFLKGGAGLGRTTITDGGSPSNTLQSTGFGYQLGTGYDIAIARRFSVTPYVNYLATAGANAEMNGTSLNTKMNANYVQYGLGLTWH